MADSAPRLSGVSSCPASPPDWQDLWADCVSFSLDSAPDRGLALGTCPCLGFAGSKPFPRRSTPGPIYFGTAWGPPADSRWLGRDARELRVSAVCSPGLPTALSRAHTYALLFSIVVEYILAKHKVWRFLELRLKLLTPPGVGDP